MWRVSWLISLTDKVQSQPFTSKAECLDFLAGFGLDGAFLSDDCMWWIVSPEGQVHLS